MSNEIITALDNANCHIVKMNPSQKVENEMKSLDWLESYERKIFKK